MNRPTHFEIPAEKPERAIRFYEKIFGWKFERWNGPMEYWNISTGDSHPGINGGLMARRDPAQPCVNTMDVADLDCNDRCDRSRWRFVRGTEDADTGCGMAGVLQRYRRTHFWSDAGRRNGKAQWVRFNNSSKASSTVSETMSSSRLFRLSMPSATQ